jgi:hypothetical protein
MEGDSTRQCEEGREVSDNGNRDTKEPLQTGDSMRQRVRGRRRRKGPTFMRYHTNMITINARTGWTGTTPRGEDQRCATSLPKGDGLWEVCYISTPSPHRSGEFWPLKIVNCRTIILLCVGRGAELLTVGGHFAAHSPDPPECFEQDAWGEADKMKEMKLLPSSRIGDVQNWENA